MTGEEEGGVRGRGKGVLLLEGDQGREREVQPTAGRAEGANEDEWNGEEDEEEDRDKGRGG
jgi:hypothetical protein